MALELPTHRGCPSALCASSHLHPPSVLLAALPAPLYKNAMNPSTRGRAETTLAISFAASSNFFFLFFFFLSFVYLCRQAPDCFFSYLRPAHTVFAMAPTALGDFAPI